LCKIFPFQEDPELSTREVLGMVNAWHLFHRI